MPAAIFSDISTVSVDLDKTEYMRRSTSCRTSWTKSRRTSRTVRSRSSSTLEHQFMCPFWFGEHFPLTNTMQKGTSASGVDSKIFGRRASLSMLENSPGWCSMATFLLCDVSTPILSLSLLRQQGWTSRGDRDGRGPGSTPDLAPATWTELEPDPGAVALANLAKMPSHNLGQRRRWRSGGWGPSNLAMVCRIPSHLLDERQTPSIGCAVRLDLEKGGPRDLRPGLSHRESSVARATSARRALGKPGR